MDLKGIQDLMGRKPIRRKEKKIGRNEPCPCKSGLKYKKCCLNKIIYKRFKTNPNKNNESNNNKS